jgi:Condensation domain
VPLETQDGPADGQARDLVAEELIIEAEQETMMPQQVPVVRASLTRFDDSDSVLVLVVHRSASGAWSRVIILRDLGACYDAQANHQPVDLPPVKQYRGYAVGQETSAADTSDARPYWRGKLPDARGFALEMRSADGAAMFLKRMLPSSETSDIPSGMVRSMSADSSGDLNGNVVYNLDEFDERKVAGWVSDYNRILLELASEPDREWRQLEGIAL